MSGTEARTLTVTDARGTVHVLVCHSWHAEMGYLVVRRDGEVVAQFAPGWRSACDDRATAQ